MEGILESSEGIEVRWWRLESGEQRMSEEDCRGGLESRRE